jgi:hypothetical protein
MTNSNITAFAKFYSPFHDKKLGYVAHGELTYTLVPFQNGWGNVNKNLPLFLCLFIKNRVAFDDTFKTEVGVKFPKIDHFQKLRFYCEDECTGQFSLPG